MSSLAQVSVSRQATFIPAFVNHCFASARKANADYERYKSTAKANISSTCADCEGEGGCSALPRTGLKATGGGSAGRSSRISTNATGKRPQTPRSSPRSHSPTRLLSRMTSPSLKLRSSCPSPSKSNLKEHNKDNFASTQTTFQLSLET